MATACAQSTSTLTLKRKRTQISCAELEDDRYDSAYESGVDVEMREPVDQLPDGDSVYGSHKVFHPIHAHVLSPSLTTSTEAN